MKWSWAFFLYISEDTGGEIFATFILSIDMLSISREAIATFQKCCARSRYQGQGQIITSHIFRAMQLLLPALDTGCCKAVHSWMGLFILLQMSTIKECTLPFDPKVQLQGHLIAPNYTYKFTKKESWDHQSRNINGHSLCYVWHHHGNFTGKIYLILTANLIGCSWI